MDFRVNEDQQELQKGIRRFCERRFTTERLRELESTGGFEAGLWAELAEMSAFNLRLPEKAGGMELGMAESVLVFSELGRVAATGPLVWTNLAAALVDGAGAGKTVVGGLDLTRPATGPIMVEHLDQLDTLLVLRSDGVDRVDARSLSGEPVALPLDPLTPMHVVESVPAGERVAGPDDARRLRREGAVLASAMLLGMAETTLSLAVEYAKLREQFGRAIGSFQAIKHMLADMFIRQEVARASVYAAGATMDDPEVGDVDRVAAVAKLEATDASMKNARACIQVHGGMGYTWEIPAHYYLKRTWVLSSVFGTDDELTEAIAADAFSE